MMGRVGLHVGNITGSNVLWRTARPFNLQMATDVHFLFNTLRRQ